VLLVTDLTEWLFLDTWDLAFIGDCESGDPRSDLPLETEYCSIFFWVKIGISCSPLADFTSSGVSQMKIAPSAPTETMNCWFGEKAIFNINYFL